MILSRLWAFKGIIGLVLLALAIGYLWVRGQSYKNDAEKYKQDYIKATERSVELNRVAKGNAKALDDYRAIVRRNLEAVKARNQDIKDLEGRLEGLRNEITDAPEADNGAVAPVVIHTLCRLRQPPSNTPPCSGN